MIQLTTIIFQCKDTKNIDKLSKIGQKNKDIFLF